MIFVWSEQHFAELLVTLVVDALSEAGEYAPL